MDKLGAVVTSNYIYAVPVVTVVTSFFVLEEPVTLMAAAGMILTIAGLAVSSWSGTGNH